MNGTSDAEYYTDRQTDHTQTTTQLRVALQMTNLTLTDRQTDDKNRDHTHDTTTDEWHFRGRTNRDRQTDGPHTDHNPCMALQMTNLTVTDRQTDDTDRQTDHTHTTT